LRLSVGLLLLLLLPKLTSLFSLLQQMTLLSKTYDLRNEHTGHRGRAANTTPGPLCVLSAALDFNFLRQLTPPRLNLNLAKHETRNAVYTLYTIRLGDENEKAEGKKTPGFPGFALLSMNKFVRTTN
jgi:hypothetical protein